MLQLRSLAHLLALARRLSFARAAEELGISQSALSRSIQALEAQLGMRLFDRDRAGVVLTPQGRIAVERAGVLIADAEDLERHLLASATAEAGKVRFGMAPMPACALLPAVMSERLDRAPEVTHEVVVRDVGALWEQLVGGEIEFFVTNEGLSFDHPPPRVETLGHFPVGGIVRAGHPLLAAACPEDARFPVLRSSWRGLPLPPTIANRMLGQPNVVEDFGSLADTTALSDAIWFSSPYAVVEELRAGTLVTLPRPEEEWPRDVAVVMVSIERRSQSPQARSIKQALRQRIKALARTGDA